MQGPFSKKAVRPPDLHPPLKFLDLSPLSPKQAEPEPGKTNIESEISFVSSSPPGIEKTVPTLSGEKPSYNPTKIPPDFADALLHAKAKRVLRLKAKFEEEGEDISDFCPCCNYPHEGETFPLLCDTLELAELGEGFPLYFNLLKWVAFLLALSFALAGSFCIYRNYDADNVKDKAMQSNWIVRGTLANYGGNKTPTIAEPSLHAAAILIILVLHNFVAIKHEKMEAELDRNAITPSDYTIIVSNIPKLQFNKTDLRQFLETHSRLDGKQCKISKVNVAYNISRYVEESLRLSRLKERLAEIHQLKSQNREPTKTVYCCFKGPEEHAEDYERMIKEQKRILSEMERNVNERFTGICFVTFREDEDARSAKKVLGKPKASRGCRDCFLALFPCFQDIQRRKYNGSVLTVRRAPDPSDILWENLGVSRCKVFGRRLATTAATAFVLCLGAGVVYSSSLIKHQISGVYKDIANPSIFQTVGFNVLSFLPSIIVVVMNIVLTATIWKFERTALHATVSDLQAAVTRNLIFAMFINTALIAIPINLNDWYGSDGLVPEIYNIMISNAVIFPLFSLFSPKALVRWIRIKSALRQGGKCMLTQQEANNLFEALPVNMPNLCASAMKTYLLSMMYAPVIPIGLAIGFIALVIQYWVNKFMLLRRHSRPIRLSDELDETMLKFIPVGCAAYAAANLYFFWDLDDKAFWPGIAACGIVLVYIVSPIQRVLKVCMRRQMKDQSIQALSETPKTYEESAIDFFTDYDRANPATSAEGNAWWIEQIAHKQGTEAAQIASSLFAQSASIKTYTKGLVPVAKNYKVQRRNETQASAMVEASRMEERNAKDRAESQSRMRQRAELFRRANGGASRLLLPH